MTIRPGHCSGAPWQEYPPSFFRRPRRSFLPGELRLEPTLKNHPWELSHIPFPMVHLQLIDPLSYPSPILSSWETSSILDAQGSRGNQQRSQLSVEQKLRLAAMMVITPPKFNSESPWKPWSLEGDPFRLGFGKFSEASYCIKLPVGYFWRWCGLCDDLPRG